MRLDKFLTDMEIGSRSQVKSYIKKGLVEVNGVVCKEPDYKVDENRDSISYDGDKLSYQKYRYYILNKPQGVVTATRDNVDSTVMDLLIGINKKDLSPVGRLDKDTEGLLLITNDGMLSHRLLAPKKHVDKVYRVILLMPITQEDMEQLEAGVDIGDESITMPAKVQKIHDTEILLTIQEGRFHQVKRMLKAVGNEVIHLKRESFGCLKLEDCLKIGTFRELSTEEVKRLKELS